MWKMDRRRRASGPSDAIMYIMGLKMNIIEVVMIGVGLSMDAFAVSIGKGLNMGKIRKMKCFGSLCFRGIPGSDASGRIPGRQAVCGKDHAD